MTESRPEREVVIDRGVALLNFFQNAFTLNAPEGYCFAPSLSRAQDGFAVLFPCGATTGMIGKSQFPSLITLQFSREMKADELADVQFMEKVFSTRAGLALLSHQNTPDSVTVLSQKSGADWVEVYFSDSSRDKKQSLQPEEWRLFSVYRNRMMTIGVRGYNRMPLTETQGSALLMQTIAAIWHQTG